MTRRERFRSALGSLRAFCDEPIENDRDVAGILQGFAFTFELAWKVLQDEIERRGYAERGPRLSLAAGLRAGIVSAEDADAWSDALKDRNLVAHSDRPDWARSLAERIVTAYLPIIERLADAADRAAREEVETLSPESSRKAALPRPAPAILGT